MKKLIAIAAIALLGALAIPAAAHAVGTPGCPPLTKCLITPVPTPTPGCPPLTKCLVTPAPSPTGITPGIRR